MKKTSSNLKENMSMLWPISTHNCQGRSRKSAICNFDWKSRLKRQKNNLNKFAEMCKFIKSCFNQKHWIKFKNQLGVELWTTSTLTIMSHPISSFTKLSIRYWNKIFMVAAIAQWIRLHLPSWSSRFESQAQHLHFSNLYLVCDVKRTNEALIGPFEKYLLLKVFLL